MLNQVRRVLQNREHAGRLLAEKLIAYKNSNAIVVAVPRGGVPIASSLAKTLHLPLDILLCKKIQHPAHSGKSIGAVCLDEVVLHEDAQLVPQTYVSHQVNKLQHLLEYQATFFNHHPDANRFTNKTVILVDDFISETNTLNTCIKSIEKQNPNRIIVAVPFTTSKAAPMLAHRQHGFIYLFMVMQPLHTLKAELFPEVTDEEVKLLLERYHEPAIVEA